MGVVLGEEQKLQVGVKMIALRAAVGVEVEREGTSCERERESRGWPQDGEGGTERDNGDWAATRVPAGERPRRLSRSPPPPARRARVSSQMTAAVSCHASSPPRSGPLGCAVPQCNGTACTAHAQLRPAGDLDLKNAEKVRVKGGERNSTAWLHHGTVCSAVRRPRGFARGVETRPQASREASPAASGAVVGRGGRSGGRA
ncbi:unnamed protein product [Lampetra fluviatilis]